MNIKQEDVQTAYNMANKIPIFDPVAISNIAASILIADAIRETIQHKESNSQ
jgi:hypothetical protein